MDEESFEPSPGSGDYGGLKPPETIGMDNSWTVLHVPLIHPLLSKRSPTFKLDATAMEQKSSTRGKAEGTEGAGADSFAGPCR